MLASFAHHVAWPCLSWCPFPQHTLIHASLWPLTCDGTHHSFLSPYYFSLYILIIKKGGHFSHINVVEALVSLVSQFLFNALADWLYSVSKCTTWSISIPDPSPLSTADFLAFWNSGSIFSCGLTDQSGPLVVLIFQIWQSAVIVVLLLPVLVIGPMFHYQGRECVTLSTMFLSLIQGKRWVVLSCMLE